jgi:hypothetical protein
LTENQQKHMSIERHGAKHQSIAEENFEILSTLEEVSVYRHYGFPPYRFNREVLAVPTHSIWNRNCLRSAWAPGANRGASHGHQFDVADR